MSIVLIENDELTAALIQKIIARHSSFTVVRYCQWPPLVPWGNTELVVTDIGMNLHPQMWQAILELTNQLIHVLVISTLPLSQLPKHPRVHWLAKPFTPYHFVKEAGLESTHGNQILRKF